MTKMGEINQGTLMQDWKMRNLSNIIIMKTGIIKEFYKGHYCTILDFPKQDILSFMLDESYKYVWGINYELYGVEWSKDIGLFNPDIDTLMRKTKTEFLMNTSDFLIQKPRLKGELHIVQVNKIPPYYLNREMIKGNKWYDLLKEEADYLFEIIFPGSPDYTEVVSPDRLFLENLLDKLNMCQHE